MVDKGVVKGSKVDEGWPLAMAVIRIVESVIESYSKTLIEMAIRGTRRELPNYRHQGNFISEVDAELHMLYRERASDVFTSFLFASEEGEPSVFPPGCPDFPEYLVLVDPLDTSELAVRGLFGHTHIMVYSISKQHPIVAVVGDMFHAIQLYCAYRDHDGNDEVFLKMRDGLVSRIHSSKEARLHEALVTNYSMRPTERFMRLAEEKGFLGALSRESPDGGRRGRIGVDFGSIGLCHVAAGFTDAMIEVAKGFPLWDLLPGQYILQAAGGTVASLDGTRLPLNLNIKHLEDIRIAMQRRQKFVAAGNEPLLALILDSLLHKK